MVKPLSGFTVGITGHRRWEEQAEMLRRRGATVVHGPTMVTKLLGDSDLTYRATVDLLAAPIDRLVLTTGIGVRSWFAAAESWGLDDGLRLALASATTCARGPKATNAGRDVGVRVAWSTPTATNRELVGRLATEGVAGQRVAVVRDGGGPTLAATLRSLGADVIDVPVYTWHLPADLEPARRLLDAAAAGRLDAVTFTCAVAVRHAFEIVDDPRALAAALNSRVLAVAVGPVAAEALRSFDVRRIVEPQRARLGSMLHALSLGLERTHRTIRLGEHTATWQGSVVVRTDGGEVELTTGERRVLETLVERAPVVVPKSALVDDGADEHAAEVAVARLRAKLGPLGDGIVSVRRRGYTSSIEVEVVADDVAS